MYYSIEEQENAILEIQRILRELDNLDTGLARVRVSGVYDDDTRQAVRAVQKKYSLPETGIVDHTTWQILQAVIKAQREAAALARAVYILPRTAEYTLTPGIRDDVVYVIQHLLKVVGQEYGVDYALPFTGVYDEATENAVKDFQRRNLLEASGSLDPATFNRLATEYERINSYNE